MNSQKKGIGVCPLLQIVLNAIFFVGIQTIFAPCAPHEDGTWMTCHWAGEALLGIAAVMLVMSLLHLLPLRTGVKGGLGVAGNHRAVGFRKVEGGFVHLHVAQLAEILRTGWETNE